MPSPPEDASPPRGARLCIVSPHLDDAVLSSHATLVDPAFGYRAVVTVVTRGVPGQVTDWCTRTGFADTAREHAVRREEDKAALASLDAIAIHLDGVTGDTRSLYAAVDACIAAQPVWLRQSQILLPAAAGRHAGLPERLWRRASRHPDPLGPHPEHRLVRDAFERSLSAAGLGGWGYYAEFPYITHEIVEACRLRLERRIGASLRTVRRAPDAESKLQAAGHYATQAPSALGATAAERLATCGYAEYLFIREPAAS